MYTSCWGTQNKDISHVKQGCTPAVGVRNRYTIPVTKVFACWRGTLTMKNTCRNGVSL